LCSIGKVQGTDTGDDKCVDSAGRVVMPHPCKQPLTRCNNEYQHG
jgi:hypothetical protein